MEENQNNKNGSPDGQFSLPENYFEDAAKRIQNKIEWGEENKIFTKLLSINRKNVFGIPEKYFPKQK